MRLPRPPPSVDDDVRCSLDVLDQVIGEFDDGLTSATESEFTPRWRPEPPSSRHRESPEEKIRPEIRGSRLSINEQIDDIFSELTEEIYNDDKVTRTERRRIFDPLPSPPNTRTHPPPVDRKKKPAGGSSSATNGSGRTDIADIRSRSIEHDRAMLVGNVAAKKQFLERNSAASSSGGRSKTGSTGGSSAGGGLPGRSQSSGSGGRSHGSADFRQKSRDGGAVIYGSEERKMPAKTDRIRADIHGNGSPPPKPEKHRIHLKGGSAERSHRTDSNSSKERFRNRQRDVSDSAERNGRDRSTRRIEETDITSKEAALMNELKVKVTDTKGKISKFSDKGGKNVPLPPPPPPPITPSQRHPMVMRPNGIDDEKNSSRTSSSSGRRNRDVSPRRGTASPVNHHRTNSSPDRRQGSPVSRTRSPVSRSNGTRSPDRRRQGARSPMGRSDGTRSPSDRGHNIRSPSERRISTHSPSGRRRNRRYDMTNSRNEDNKRSKSLGPLQARHDSPTRHNSRGSKDRRQDNDDNRGRSRSRGRRADDRQIHDAAGRPPGDGASFHRSKSHGRYSPSRPSELDRSGQGGRELGAGGRYRDGGEQRRVDSSRRSQALSQSRRVGEFSPNRRDGFSPVRREGFSPVREMRGVGGPHLAPPSPEEAQAVLEKMLPRVKKCLNHDTLVELDFRISGKFTRSVGEHTNPQYQEPSSFNSRFASRGGPPGSAGMPPMRQRSLVDLRLSEEFRRRHNNNNNNNMNKRPFTDDFPVHIRNQINVARNFGVRPDIPGYIDEQLRWQHQMNIDAQRELLVRRGFPHTHPLVAGEISIHPELLGHLHFDIPSRTTLPLNPDDFRRFLPEMQRSGMQSAFPFSTSDLVNLQKEEMAKKEGDSKIKRQKSYKETTFTSLQHAAAIENKNKKNNKKSRSQSTDARDKKFRPFSMFSFNQAPVEHSGKKEKPWFGKDRPDLQSLPNTLETTQPNNGMGIKNRYGSDKYLNRNEKNRSSFGMILKDKFQKNPNMYFPDTRPASRSPEYTKSSSSRRQSQTPGGKGEELSDTDTLIHNMSEGSFDKDSDLSGGRSIGSNHSSGKSSLSHDSINGTPEMKRRSESITTPKQIHNTAVHLASNPSIILNKKTIRNYTPQESSNLLRQFEEDRHTSKDKRKAENVDKERRSSMDKLIDDFHRNLPPVKDTESTSPFSDVDSMFSGPPMDPSTIPSISATPMHGTVTSQTSNWSVASSAASFDYHIITSDDLKHTAAASTRPKSKDNSTRRKFSQSTANLPSLMEIDLKDEKSPVEERIPPEGASSDSPKQFIQRIEVKAEERRSSSNSSTGDKKPKPPRKSGKEAAKEAVQDLLTPDADGDDELSMLKKLISEGRISGLDEKPPSFKPPTPPSKAASASRKLNTPTRSNSSPRTPDIRKTPSSGGDRPRKKTEAPPPPTTAEKSRATTSTSQTRTESSAAKNRKPSPKRHRSPERPVSSENKPRSKSKSPPKGGVDQVDYQEEEAIKAPPETSEIKFIGGRRILSMENLQEEGSSWKENRSSGRKEEPRKAASRSPKSESIQRSTSMHLHRDARSGDSRSPNGEASPDSEALAKLIADSTEKKFKINNIFKGMWKKKHYSFDLS